MNRTWRGDYASATKTQLEASTTLADLLTPSLVANPFAAMRASLRWWWREGFENGVAHGWQSRLRRWPVDSFFPPLLLQGGDAGGGVSDHRHQRMTMQALPGPALEVIEAEFLFELLVSLLANPSRLDGGRQGAQVGLCRQVGEIVFLLSRQPVFADEPGLVPWQVLLTLVPDALRRSVGDPHADSSKTSLELAFRAGAPADGLPFGGCQQVFGGPR